MTNETFQGWKSLSVTIEIYEKLEELKRTLEKGMGEGQTLCITADETHGSTARMVGNIEGLNQLLNISYEDEIEEKDDE
jgi:hypothetical protein